MATDLENSIRSAAEKIASYIEDVATMTVETSYVKVDDKGVIDFSQAKPVARTVVKLDGDSEAIVPIRTSETGAMVVDTDLLELHHRNVSTTIEYRAQLLSALIGMLKSFSK
jgi:hypothetical protein